MSGKKDDIFSGISDISFDSVMGGSSKKPLRQRIDPKKIRRKRSLSETKPNGISF